MATTKKNMTLADHAEAWWKEQGNTVPPKGSDAYNEMYEKWAKMAFKDFEKKDKQHPERWDGMS